MERVIDAANPPEKRIPRNAPALFNLGAAEFVSFFHDGRLEVDKTRTSRIRTPLGGEMENGVATLLSAQTMFPVLSAAEMAGHFSENDVSKAVRQGVLTGLGGAWVILVKRIENIPEYRARFDPIVGADDPIHFTDISDAIAACSKRIMISMPQIGPGKAAEFERHQGDEGRMRVTGDPADAYAFRTPSLRNVAHISPYGHSCAYGTLEGVVRHQLDPIASLNAYLESAAVLSLTMGEDDFVAMRDADKVAKIAAANELESIDLNEKEIAEIIAFLNALTDPQSLKGALRIPSSALSGLPLDQ